MSLSLLLACSASSHLALEDALARLEAPHDWEPIALAVTLRSADRACSEIEAGLPDLSSPSCDARIVATHALLADRAEAWAEEGALDEARGLAFGLTDPLVADLGRRRIPVADRLRIVRTSRELEAR